MNKLKNKILASLLFAIGVVLFFLINAVQSNLSSPKVNRKQKLDFTKDRSYPLSNVCEQADFGHFIINSKVRIHNALYNANKPLDAIKEQLKYAPGLLYFQASNKALARYAGFEDIQIQKTERVNYQDEFVVKSPYPLTLTKDLVIKRSDPAFEISYSAKIKIFYCSEFPDSEMTINLPIDPYLVYWSVPSKYNEKINFNKATTSINPCADIRMGSENYPPHLWYFWNPNRTTKNGFNCFEFLYDRGMISNRKYRIIKEQKITTSNPDQTNFKTIKEKDHIQMSIVFGVLSSKDFDSNLIEIQNILNQYIKDADIKRIGRSRQLTLRALQKLLSRIPNINSAKMTLTKNKNHLIFKIDNLVLETSKKISLSLYIGYTDYYSPLSQHWRFLESAFKESDFIFYISHSGHGENMKMNNIRDKLGLDSNKFKNLINTKDYQLLAIISCFSTSYHSHEYLEMRDSSKKSNLLLMGSEGYAFSVPLAFIHYLNSTNNEIPIMDYVWSYSTPSIDQLYLTGIWP